MAAFAPFATGYTAEPRRPANGPQPGAVALLDYICDDSPWASVFTSLGIYNPRDVCGNPWPEWECVGSQHARGAAGDAGCRVVRPGGLEEGWQLALWLTKNHAVLGVQEVIFAGQRWTNQTLRWRAYNGASDHYDHVHFALNASGARYLTTDRILSVAPDTEDDFMAALTDAQQRELYANSKATLLLATATNSAVAKTVSMSVVRRKGSSGIRTVSLAWGGFRIPLTQEQADAFKYVLSQSAAVTLPVSMFDVLVDVSDIDNLAALIAAA